MLQRCISAEWLKLRHSHIWIILMVLPVFSILIGGANYCFNQSVLTNGWYSLWTQVSLFYGEFFLPVLIAICCAYVCRLEHMNKNWNTLMTAPISPWCVFLSKLFIVGVLILAVQIFFLTLYLCAGRLVGLPQQFPAETFGWIFRGWVSSVTVSAVQLGLSIRIRSFAVPIGISICAVFIGLGMYVAKVGMLFPYSLLTIGMGVLSQESLTSIEKTLFYMMNIIFIILVCVISIRHLKKADVTA